MKNHSLDNLYETCKNINGEELTELLKKANSYEEKAFYVTISDFFLQQRQKEVVEKGIF